MNIAAQRRGRRRPADRREQALNLATVAALRGQTAQEQVVNRLAVKLAARQNKAQHLHQQRLPRAEEAANPDAGVAPFAAVRGLRPAVEHLPHMLLPLRRDDKVVQLMEHPLRIAIRNLHHRLDAVADVGGEGLDNLHSDILSTVHQQRLRRVRQEVVGAARVGHPESRHQEHDGNGTARG